MAARQQTQAIMLASDVLRLLGGERTGAGALVRCPVPTHGKGKGDRSPSLLVRDGEKGLLVSCRAGCESREVLRCLRDALGDDDYEPREIETRQVDDDERKRFMVAKARETWRSARPIAGTLAETYLRDERGLGDVLAHDLNHSVRYIERCRFGSKGNERYSPAMVCAMRPFTQTIDLAFKWLESDGANERINSDVDLVCGVHRTELSPDAKKAGRAMLGNAGAIFLSTPYECAARQCLTVGEGVETTLTALALGYRGCVAAGAAGGMANMATNDGLRDIFIIKENDAAGIEAANKSAQRWHLAGARVRFIVSQRGNDINDAIRQGGA